MKIPRKNVFKKMFDIRKPGQLSAGGIPDASKNELSLSAGASVLKTGKIQGAAIGQIPPKKFSWKILIFALLILVVFGGGFIALFAYQSKIDLFKRAAQSLENSGISARLKLPSGEELEIRSLADIQNKIIPIVRANFGAYQGLTELSGVWVRLSSDLDGFTTAFSANLSGADSRSFLPSLIKIKNDVASLKSAADKLDASGLDIKQMFSISPADYLKIKFELNYWDKALSGLVKWLNNDRRIVIFLQNSSEMRPTGGFWGSFLEVDIENGAIATTTLRDVSEIDRVLNTKTIPPKPLQALVANWRTADSNWFPDFRDSAAKAKVFLDSSGVYASSSLKTDAILAISPRVVSDILSVLGPISVSSTKASITSDNFISAIQEEVQAGHDVGSKNAKKVLKEAMPAILAELMTLGASQQDALMNLAIDWPGDKNIMFWAEDSALEELFRTRSIDGALFEIPQKFNGDYLSVIGANIGGGKSDYVMRQEINLESQLGLDGMVSNHLEVARVNAAGKKDDWWYRMANQFYARVYLAPGSNLQQASGGIKKTVYAPINYKKSGYVSDALVSGIEATEEKVPGYNWLSQFMESGKVVFASWLKTVPGKTDKLALDYSRRLFSIPEDGTPYEFVYDKQPGVVSKYNFSISAPVGFVWAENDSPVYEYKSDEIPGRLTIYLTLKKSK